MIHFCHNRLTSNNKCLLLISRLWVKTLARAPIIQHLVHQIMPKNNSNTTKATLILISKDSSKILAIILNQVHETKNNLIKCKRQLTLEISPSKSLISKSNCQTIASCHPLSKLNHPSILLLTITLILTLILFLILILILIDW